MSCRRLRSLQVCLSLKSLIAIQALLFEHSFIPCQILKDVKAELDRIPVSLLKTLKVKIDKTYTCHLPLR